MAPNPTPARIWIVLFALLLPILVIGLLMSAPSGKAQISGPALAADSIEFDTDDETEPQLGAEPTSACPGGPTIDGLLLDECYTLNFTVGGSSKSITVWYTKVISTVTRTRSDSSTVTLQHWISTDAQAQQVAAWGKEAWQQYFTVFGRHPYDKGCGNKINVRMEDGDGWGGIAYWASSGNCWIGIDSPTVRGGGGQWVVYHEFQHYQQYSFDDGCYKFLKDNYDNGSAAGDAEFVEGYADLGADSVNNTLDLTGYGGVTYNPSTSMYDKSYGNLFNKYFIEQLGTIFTPADSRHHMDAVLDHYLECDNQDTLYVLDTLIPSLSPGTTEEDLFLDFFAANWAKDWADPSTQPELVYTDDDGNPYGSIALAQDVNISTGTKSWNSQSTPDDWAGRYYQVKPQSGCNFVTASVDGAAGAHLGINLMAADTAGTTSVQRAAWIGEDFDRTFPGAGVYDRIVASVNAFATNATYDVSFDCITPLIDILEPKQGSPAQVGEPASPIAFLARFKVTSGGAPVLGIAESAVTAEAEGDAVTIVPGTLQQVSEEYWAVMRPPNKPAGTTLVDLTICLNGSVCATETDALNYEPPGNTDFGLVFDASGSMATEDLPGEGTRLENAKKAGTVLADLLVVGDRILVTDFSAFDSPPGCGLPGGDGNCPLDIRTRLARTDVTGPATISAAESAINLISAREWTPIGGALRDAKNKLQAAPYSLNPKHIVLLSDGEENVNPLYADVRSELIASGVVIDTIGFSYEAPEPLLAQIAADTGGTFRFVPTTGGVLAAVSQQQKNEWLEMGVPPDYVQQLAAQVLPGPLGLDDVYDYYETKSQGATRLFNATFTASADNTWQEQTTVVDKSVNTLRLVVAGKQADSDVPAICEGYHRSVEVLPADASDPQRGWIPVSPPDKSLPADWDVRNSLYDDVVIISNPAQGVWKVRTKYYYLLCKQGVVDEAATVESAAASTSDFLMNGSVQSVIRLQGRFLPPITNNKGMAGDSVPIVGTLFDRNGTIPGAQFFGVNGIPVIIEKPGASDLLFLFDDGGHNDGAADDGIYGNNYSLTTVGGSYNVRMVAFLWDATLGQWITREWLGGFWIDGPQANDLDKDGMPDPWEARCRLDTKRNDAQEDLDLDLLNNIQEFQYGTLPCDADTDNGGEGDGSEVLGGRNPRYAPDDLVRPLGHISVAGLNKMIRIRWTHPLSYTNMLVFLSTSPDLLGNAVDMGNSGLFTETQVTNDTTYYLRLIGVNGTAIGDYSDVFTTTPKADPDPPSGAILIDNGAATTRSSSVRLYISSSDDPLPGAAESANAHLGGPLALKYNTVSGNVEMRISNDPSFAGASWEPLAAEKPWNLTDSAPGVYRVYAQFRDAAKNESFIVYDDIILEPKTYLPIILR